ncbi:MAG TPA: triple tyrosine motif-containing protein [Steroidobacteraceae bacterium]|nr:triple tyrosine motif-containing protein [Steroidobacteraceae bacterium]
MRDDAGALWVYTACGIARIELPELERWEADLGHGVGSSGIRATVVDSSEGVVNAAPPIGSYSPHVAKSQDGRIWFATPSGVGVLDPRNLHANGRAPPVHIEQVTADRKSYAPVTPLRLPAQLRDLQLDYTALSLVAPEKMLFRYKLEGRDRDWQEAGNRRQAFYSDLAPGNYRFRVIASNNSGVWNEQGATLDFSISPAYWQTTWFRALCVTAILLVLWALYQLRLRQLTRTFNLTLEARVGERTRIARDLHDTLLQSFQGLLLRFQTVADLLPTRPTEAKRIVVSAVDQAAQAITEGRHAVEGLRTSAAESTDLAAELRTLGELAAAETHNESVRLTVDVEGTPRALKPIVRDEIYRIAGEALRNAFRHAAATRIELELRYDARQLRLRVRDDGKGIGPKALSEATEGAIAGHHGLRGMRERASLIGGKLTVWTAPDSGTEVELIVRASRVYARPASRGRSWLAQRFARKSA